jgi:secreted PhoX family phosphatase
MSVSRRQFLVQAAAFSLGFQGMQTLFARNAFASPRASQLTEGFGPLRPDPAGILELAEGFTYKVISRRGDAMDDGLRVPGAQDGMAAFAGPNGKTILVCNHELSSDNVAYGGFGDDYGLLAKLDASKLFDNGHGKTPALGGTTTLVYDTRTQSLERRFLSLAGTARNCAGGPTPWNSWITCEETTQRADAMHAQDHGWCFEVPAQAEGGPVTPVALKDMGRFNHEAIAVDAHSGVVYLTEDRPDGLLYRFLPNAPGKLAEGGRLQALSIQDERSCDTRNWEGTPRIAPGTMLKTAWIDVHNPASPEDDLRLQGFEAGAARFARGEGMWYADGVIYFACTNGGAAYKGQVWKYRPSPMEGRTEEAQQPGTLELFVEPNDGGLIDNADNLTVAPWGDLILCEDGSGEQFLVGVTPEASIYKLARNAMASNSEFAGVSFAPDGSTLFVNIQTEGLTLAITGPWRAARA